MPDLDLNRPFRPVRVAVLTISDTRDLASDASGALLVGRLEAAGHVLADRSILPDEAEAIEAKLRAWINEPSVEVVLSTGGTGITKRDVTPEAFERVIEKRIEGFGELFRWISFGKIGTATIQSRALAGVAGGTLLFGLPGSRGAVADAWDEILVHQLDNRFRPCNFIELLPRLV